jgi:hypothetical protein
VGGEFAVQHRPKAKGGDSARINARLDLQLAKLRTLVALSKTPIPAACLAFSFFNALRVYAGIFLSSGDIPISVVTLLPPAQQHLGQ